MENTYYVVLSVVVSNVLPQGPNDDHTQNTWEKKILQAVIELNVHFLRAHLLLPAS